MIDRFASLIVTLAVISPIPAAAQGPQTTSVFVDCEVRNCDFDHLRREVEWVNFVRDRENAAVHVLVTSQETGGEGVRYTIDYIGRGEFVGTDKSLSYTTDPTSTDSEIRDGLTAVIAVGLIQYVEASPVAPLIRIDRIASETSERADDTDDRDPWNLWVFQLGGDISVEGESSEREYEVEGFVSAGRVSEEFKVNIFSSIEYQREEFDDLGDGSSFVNSTFDYEFNTLAVWSLGPRWSFGAQIEAEKSTFSNQDIQVVVGPALEYNIFPWSESTRRALAFRYLLEVAYFDYEVVTIENQTSEVLPRQSFQVEADVQQPWGEIFGFVGVTQYFHDLSTHRIDTFLSVEYRLFRGFGIDLFASVDRIKDQFFLPAEDLSPEEILLRRRQRETGFRYDVGIGFTYRFGSQFANAVNPRFD